MAHMIWVSTILYNRLKGYVVVLPLPQRTHQNHGTKKFDDCPRNPDQTHHNVTYLIVQWLAWLWTETFNFVVKDSKYIIFDISICTCDHISKIAFPISSSWLVYQTIITSTIHMNSVFSQFSNTMTSFYNVLSGQLPVHFQPISGSLPVNFR